MGSLTNATPGSGVDPFAGFSSFGSDFSNWAGQRPMAPQMGQNPYMNGWGALLRQLSQNDGQSLAGNAYKQASDTAMHQQLALAHGGSPGAVQAAQNNLGRIQQGLAQGYSNAALQEKLAKMQMMQQALTGAGNAWYQTNYANLMAQMNQPTNLQMLTGFLGQALPAMAML
jgi:hypothetical protein